MKKTLARCGLFCLGLITPVFIAACYGVSYGFTMLGRVIDAGSKGGLAGIQVSCVGSRNGTDEVLSTTTSAGDGSFSMEYRPTTDCETLRFEDVDGADNGGAFQTQEKAFDGEQNVLIELQPKA